MKAAVFAFSRRGMETAGKLGKFLENPAFYCPERLAEGEFLPIPKPSRDFYGEQFAQKDALIFVGSCGIAVREIAPHVRSKRTDPAVIVCDECGAFVIALLSGHLGGANDLAERLADAVGATPVITTATDRNGKFSVDRWAAEHGFVLSSMAFAKEISARILEEDVHMASDFPVESWPAGVVPGDSGQLGILLSWEEKEPFSHTLRLIPRALRLGIGCRRGTSAEAIEAAVRTVFRENRLDLRAVKELCSVDLKQDEAGLLEFARRLDVPAKFYAAEALNSLSGDFTSSEFVKKITGVDCVCERAAMMGAHRLIVKKTALDGVTVAVAAEKVEVCFGKADGCGHRPREL